MKVGSLVMCVNNNGIVNEAIKPNTVDIYTVREIFDGDAIMLDEIKNGIAPNGYEWSYYMHRFREVQPPMDLSELLECELVNT